MKSYALISFLFLGLSFQAHAAVYCKENGKIYDAASEDGHFECAGALMMGSACFTGPRSAVLELFNDDVFNWDEEWLEEAYYHGPDAISYVFRDGPNEISEKVVINRCSTQFFKN
ncbi:hypothetical protein QJS83_07505 [Bdellovibrio sp. 22V]|uniref:hypothetical protein n=1 Tax=Bdellovibrio sp. 22V TaxID=3044166 RepID=UPI0025435A8E|nr:hypothetical protein [Bdellovibrio sp. 22V]WII73720.1 hypothetical protein QJS83_07505 [Bdellovibrio sp. 22V]